jgi:hypothetical protein
MNSSMIRKPSKFLFLGCVWLCANIKGKRYGYAQTFVRKGKKVQTISKYVGAVLTAPLVAAALVSEHAKRAKPPYPSID